MTKGPHLTGPAKARHALVDCEYPAMLLHEDAVEHNLATMARYCGTHEVDLAPHAKTSLSPQLVSRQLDLGAWGMTAATPAQVRGLRGLGVERILLANELVDRASIAWIRDHLLGSPGAEFLCYVDSPAGVALLAAELHGTDCPLEVLVEIGYAGGRTGTRTPEESLDVARAVVAEPSLRLAGVAGFEGMLSLQEVDGFLHSIAVAAREFHRSGLFEVTRPVVSAGGSSYFDRVVAILAPPALGVPARTVLRSGCYVTHDHGLYRDTSPFDARSTGDARLLPAFELLATVLSRPEPGLAIVGFGRRDVPIDDRLPVVLGRYDETGRRGAVEGAMVTRLNDQHAYLRVPEELAIGPGEVWSFGISHPCGAFDRWPAIPLVAPDLSVTGIITTDL